jgi:hypothetical protein
MRFRMSFLRRGRVGLPEMIAREQINPLSPIVAFTLLANATVDQENPAQRDQPTDDLVDRKRLA